MAEKFQLGASVPWESAKSGEPAWDRKLDSAIAGTLARMRVATLGYEERERHFREQAQEILTNLRLGLAVDITPAVELMQWVCLHADPFLRSELQKAIDLNSQYRTASGRYVRPGALAAGWS